MSLNLVLDDGVGELGTHDADAPVGVALQLDDLVRGADYFFVSLVPFLVVVRILPRYRMYIP